MKATYKSGGNIATHSIRGFIAARSSCSGICVGLALAACALASHSALAAGVVVKGTHLKVNGVSYFRGNAENVQLGTYGYKKSPVVSMNYLAADGVIPRKKLGRVQKVVVLDIDASRTSKADLFANISDVTKVFGMSAEAAWEKVKENKLKLVKFVISNSDLRTAVNHSPKALNQLRSRGKRARIASEIFAVLKAETAESFKRSGSIEVSGTDGKVNLKARGSGSSSGDTKVTLSKGSTFAYGLVKLDWKRGKKEVETVKNDQWSFN